jgi:hypothetical protein
MAETCKATPDEHPNPIRLGSRGSTDEPTFGGRVARLRIGDGGVSSLQVPNGCEHQPPLSSGDRFQAAVSHIRGEDCGCRRTDPAAWAAAAKVRLSVVGGPRVGNSRRGFLSVFPIIRSSPLLPVKGKGNKERLVPPPEPMLVSLRQL